MGEKCGSMPEPHYNLLQQKTLFSTESGVFGPGPPFSPWGPRAGRRQTVFFWEGVYNEGDKPGVGPEKDRRRRCRSISKSSCSDF